MAPSIISSRDQRKQFDDAVKHAVQQRKQQNQLHTTARAKIVLENKLQNKKVPQTRKQQETRQRELREMNRKLQMLTGSVALISTRQLGGTSSRNLMGGGLGGGGGGSSDVEHVDGLGGGSGGRTMDSDGQQKSARWGSARNLGTSEHCAHVLSNLQQTDFTADTLPGASDSRPGSGMPRKSKFGTRRKTMAGPAPPQGAIHRSMSYGELSADSPADNLPARKSSVGSGRRMTAPGRALDAVEPGRALDAVEEGAIPRASSYAELRDASSDQRRTPRLPPPPRRQPDSRYAERAPTRAVPRPRRSTMACERPVPRSDVVKRSSLSFESATLARSTEMRSAGLEPNAPWSPGSYVPAHRTTGRRMSSLVEGGSSSGTDLSPTPTSGRQRRGSKTLDAGAFNLQELVPTKRSSRSIGAGSSQDSLCVGSSQDYEDDFYVGSEQDDDEDYDNTVGLEVDVEREAEINELLLEARGEIQKLPSRAIEDEGEKLEIKKMPWLEKQREAVKDDAPGDDCEISSNARASTASSLADSPFIDKTSLLSAAAANVKLAASTNNDVGSAPKTKNYPALLATREAEQVAAEPVAMKQEPQHQQRGAMPSAAAVADSKRATSTNIEAAGAPRTNTYLELLAARVLAAKPRQQRETPNNPASSDRSGSIEIDNIGLSDPRSEFFLQKKELTSQSGATRRTGATSQSSIFSSMNSMSLQAATAIVGGIDEQQGISISGHNSGQLTVSGHDSGECNVCASIEEEKSFRQQPQDSQQPKQQQQETPFEEEQVKIQFEGFSRYKKKRNSRIKRLKSSIRKSLGRSSGQSKSSAVSSLGGDDSIHSSTGLPIAGRQDGCESRFSIPTISADQQHSVRHHLTQPGSNRSLTSAYTTLSAMAPGSSSRSISSSSSKTGGTGKSGRWNLRGLRRSANKKTSSQNDIERSANSGRELLPRQDSKSGQQVLFSRAVRRDSGVSDVSSPSSDSMSNSVWNQRSAAPDKDLIYDLDDHVKAMSCVLSKGGSVTSLIRIPSTLASVNENVVEHVNEDERSVTDVSVTGATAVDWTAGQELPSPPTDGRARRVDYKSEEKRDEDFHTLSASTEAQDCIIDREVIRSGNSDDDHEVVLIQSPADQSTCSDDSANSFYRHPAHDGPLVHIRPNQVFPDSPGWQCDVCYTEFFDLNRWAFVSTCTNYVVCESCFGRKGRRITEHCQLADDKR